MALAVSATPVDRLVGDFSRFLVREDRSICTVHAYGWALRDFTDFLGSQYVVDLRQLDGPPGRALLEAWQDRLLAARLRPRSRSLATTGVRQFLKWAANHDYCDPRLKDWLASVRVQVLQPKPLTPAALATLVAYYGQPLDPGAPKQPYRLTYRLQWLRNAAMFFYFVSTGARVSEALQVPRADYRRVTVRQKGGSEKLMVLSNGAEPIVRRYLEARTDQSALLFVSHPAARAMGPGAVRGVWQEVAAELGLPLFTTHQLRHTFATELLDAGVDPVTVAELMGHRGMQTIRNYAQVREASRTRAMQAIDQVLLAVDPVLQLRAAAALRGPSRVADVKLSPTDPRLLPRLNGQRGRPRFAIAQPLPASDGRQPDGGE